MMKHIKTFNEKIEEWKINWLKDFDALTIGQKVDSNDVYEYILAFHDRHELEDEDTEDILRRVDSAHHFEYQLIDISEIDTDRFDTEDDVIEEYEETIIGDNYPPIVVLDEPPYAYEIIDGAHRCKALMRKGIKKVKAFVGYK